MTPKRRQAWIVDPELPVPNSNPLVTELDDGCSFWPERDGQALLSGHFGRDPPHNLDEYEKSHDVGWVVGVIQHLANYVLAEPGT